MSGSQGCKYPIPPWKKNEYNRIPIDGAPWARWPWQRCKAQSMWNHRCDLKKGHIGMHVVSRGMDEYQFKGLLHVK